MRLELETALAKTQDEISTYLTPQIVTGEGNIVFHCEWDNLNGTNRKVHGNIIVNNGDGSVTFTYYFANIMLLSVK